MKTIARKNQPPTAPLLATITWWLFLDRLDVGGVAWGVFYTVAAIVWTHAIYIVFKTEQVDIFE